MAEKTQKINKIKTEAVNKIKKIISGAKDLIFTDYRGIKVRQMTELRAKLHNENSRLRIIKNNYTKIAFNELSFPDASDFLFGPTAITIITKDTNAVAKILLAFTKDVPLKINGGIIDGKIYQKEEIIELSRLPSREVLLARLLYSLNAPATNLVYVQKAVIEKLVRTVKAIELEKEKQH